MKDTSSVKPRPPLCVTLPTCYSLTVEEVGEDDLEVLVAGELVGPVGGAGGGQAEDGRAEVGDARLEQEEGQPAGDELQGGQVVGLPGTDLRGEPQATRR